MLLGINIKLVWLAVAVIFGIGEMFTAGLTLIWFSFGALATMFLTTYVESIPIQVVIFGVSSSIMLFIATKLMVKKDESYISNTNIDALIGKYAIVEKDVSNIAYGIVNLEGEKWTAVSEKEVTYKKGEKVKVVRIDGVKLVVTK
ncbi:NfeD family protein [Peptacetobacter hiranonis]|uniref:NfeD family protein n=1 Tax=Peptacetobacter hiranonis TaxID=89152 RepID=UPI0022E02C4E|nr:NfeD family protein [Peptacetobacter hiranonis]MEE0248466.1 NfeD family protein [Peptacetobacter hiranonis]